MVLDGYQDNQINEWRQTRLISFLIYCSATLPEKRDAKTEYDFLELPGDPSKEERVKKQHDDIDQRYKRIMQMSRHE